MRSKEKPKYGWASCLGFMLGTAWRTRKRVPFVCLLLACLRTGQSLVQLFLGPEILRRVETAAPLPELLGAVGLFTLGLLLLSGVVKYVDGITPWSRADVRSSLVLDANDKSCTTSYANTLDPVFQRLQRKAEYAMDGDSEATQHIWTTLTDLLNTVLGFCVYLLLLRDLEPWLLVSVTVTAAAGYFATLRVQAWEQAHRRESEGYFAKLAYLYETARSPRVAKDVRIFGLKSWLDQICERVLMLVDGFLSRRERAHLLGSLAAVVLTLARNGLAYFVLLRLALEGKLSAAEFLLYFTAVTEFTGWITTFRERCAELRRECLDISAVREFLDWPEPFRFGAGAAIPERADGCELRLEKVSYRYPGAERDTIHSMDLTIRPGEKLAIVGLNGAGKTTLVKLLCGFLDPTEGVVRYNGVDIREFDRREYYHRFSAVFQEFSVLDVTVAENVAQRTEDIDRARVADCLEKAGLTEAVAALPQGMDTHVGRKVYLDGVEFSGGQTQRLMLARALYRDGAVLVLDEPTAALDPIAEDDIYRKYSAMTAGKTSVFISHRLASTRFCDRILFLADGQIAEEGTHEALLAQGGGYAELFEIQSRYYREGRHF